jgi:ADP-ribosyl-[dinitrogen reductase] hydrolase
MEQDKLKIDAFDRYWGCLLGLAAGDAFGTPLEFKRPGSFKPLTDMVGGGPFELAVGQWTDDTAMALCLAESLTETGGFDALDQMKRYVRWYRQGYMSSTGRCFDIGNTVRDALHRFEASGDPISGSTHPYSAGNGSLMRLAPVPMFYARHPRIAIERSAQSSRTTHAAQAAVDACAYFGGLLVGALNGVSKEDLLSGAYAPIPGYWSDRSLSREIEEVACGSFKLRNPPEIKGSGYVVRSLEAALWAFYNSENFREGCLLAANLGEDADTTAAIYGQLAGAYYGVLDIPDPWRSQIALRSLIKTLAEKLFTMAQDRPPEL